MESIANILIYFSRNGYIPWMDGEEEMYGEKPDDRWFAKIRNEMTDEKITQDCPMHIVEFYQYTKSLKFKETPDYKWCLGLFQRYLDDHKFQLKEDQWDWDIHRQRCI